MKENLHGLYICHYCDEQIEMDNDTVQIQNGKLLWRCPCCGMYNDTPATEPFDD